MPSTSTRAVDRSTKAIDLEGFAREVQALRREILASLGEEDLAHLRKMERWGRTATAVGLATAWAGPNPVSALGLALGRGTRWLVMHHVGHRGYDRVPGVPAKYTSAVFATGRRRFLDWPDWIEPEAWKHEHNVLHHANTSEEADPDLIERNAAWVHRLPEPVRWVMLGFLAATWRATYYAPNTMGALLQKEAQQEAQQAALRDGEPGPGNGAPPSTARSAARTQPSAKGSPVMSSDEARAVLLRCWLPYAGYAFVGLPLLFAPLGPLAVASAFCNSLLADVLTNMHTFLVVGPNHAGDDLHRFDDRPASKGEHLARQILGSTNYTTGGDMCDFAHLWLNYQVEHHLFPDVPMLQYRKVQPRVKALCEKYGLPYIQESVFVRFAKMAEVFVGRKAMRRDAAAVMPPRRQQRDTERDRASSVGRGATHEDAAELA